MLLVALGRSYFHLLNDGGMRMLLGILHWDETTGISACGFLYTKVKGFTLWIGSTLSELKEVGKTRGYKHVLHLGLQALDVKPAMVGAAALVDGHHQPKPA